MKSFQAIIIQAMKKLEEKKRDQNVGSQSKTKRNKPNTLI